MNLTRIAGTGSETGADIARQIETDAAALISRLQQMNSDAAGFGRIAVREYTTINAWETSDWPLLYAGAPVRVTAEVYLK